MAEDDPPRIRSIAVSPEDVVDAFVYGRENPGTAVLRVTAPFHGRMRARLHVYRVDDARETGAIHVAPADLLDEDVVSEYPTLEATAARLAADEDGSSNARENDVENPDPDGTVEDPDPDGAEDAHTTEIGGGGSDGGEGRNGPSPSPPPERVRQAHAAAVERWRARALESIAESVAVSLDHVGGDREARVDVDRLGGA